MSSGRETSYFSQVTEQDPTEPELLCVLCGRPLGYSTDDQPDWPTGPMCGDCYQARELDNDLWDMELNSDDA